MVATIRNSRLLGNGLLILAVIHLFVQLAVLVPRELARTDRTRDVAVYYDAASNVREGRPLYRLQPGYGPDRLPEAVYIYPPPFAAVLSPLAALPFDTFARLWHLLQLTSLWGFACALARLARAQKPTSFPPWRTILIWGMAVSLWPGSYQALALGQIDPFLWMLCGWGVLGLARTPLWSVAALVKVFYAWPLLLQAIHLRRASFKTLAKIYWPAVTIVALLMVLGAVACGPASYIVWARDVLPTLSQGNFNSQNLSLTMAVLRLARICGWEYSGGALPPLAHFWLTAAALLGPLLTWYLARRQHLELQCGFVITAAALCAPVCWTSYLPIAALPLALWIGKKNRIRSFHGNTPSP